MMKEKLTCLIISTGRSGSTAIYSYINEIANLNLPDKKEPHYWCDIYRFDGLYDGLKDIYVSDESEYYNLYVNSALAIDASVGYFFCIEEVIENLKKKNLKPKVIFLYREPFGRTLSHYNKLIGKGMIKDVKIIDEIKLERKKGLWWEWYYDNVNYFNSFKSIEGYFDNILTINYDFFSENTDLVMSRILSFLDIKKQKTIEYKPINTSSEAILTSRIRSFSFIKQILPKDFIVRLKKNLLKNLQIKNKNIDFVFDPYIKKSLEQYFLFREYIKFQDIICLKK